MTKSTGTKVELLDRKRFGTFATIIEVYKQGIKELLLQCDNGDLIERNRHQVRLVKKERKMV